MPIMSSGKRASPFRGRVRRTAPAPTRRAPAVLALASLLGVGLAPALEAAEEVPIVGSETIIGDLIPITGDAIETRSVDLLVEFRLDSAGITERAEAQLRELGVALTSRALRESALAVYGHTDSSGPADYNRELSERRANAVAVFLREHFAIEEARFREVRGFGEAHPREDLPPSDPAQRRVEIVTFHERSSREAGTSESTDSAVADDTEAAVVLPGTGDGADSGTGTAETADPEDSGDDEATTESGYVVIE